MKKQTTLIVACGAACLAALSVLSVTGVQEVDAISAYHAETYYNPYLNTITIVFEQSVHSHGRIGVSVNSTDVSLDVVPSKHPNEILLLLEPGSFDLIAMNNCRDIVVDIQYAELSKTPDEDPLVFGSYNFATNCSIVAANGAILNDINRQLAENREQIVQIQAQLELIADLVRDKE